MSDIDLIVYVQDSTLHEKLQVQFSKDSIHENIEDVIDAFESSVDQSRTEVIASIVTIGDTYRRFDHFDGGQVEHLKIWLENLVLQATGVEVTDGKE